MGFDIKGINMEREQIKSVNRREFFKFIIVGWSFFALGMAGGFSMFFRYFYPNLNFEPEMDFLAGRPGDYNLGVWCMDSSPR